MVKTIRIEKSESENKSFKVKLVEIKADMEAQKVWAVFFKYNIQNSKNNSFVCFETLEDATSYFNRKYSELIKKVA